jgi:hypothetical protein
VYSYFLAGPLSYTAIVSAVSVAEAETTTMNNINNRDMTVTWNDIKYISIRIGRGQNWMLIILLGCQNFQEIRHFYIK